MDLNISTHFFIASSISNGLILPSIRFCSQKIASNKTNVHDGKLCDLAKKLIPFTGLFIASSISVNGAVGLIFNSFKNLLKQKTLTYFVGGKSVRNYESSLSSFVVGTVLAFGSALFNDNPAASAAGDTRPGPFSIVFVPDLRKS